MDITYLGHSCFKIKGENATLLTDPYDSSIGFKMPRVEADIVTISHQHADHNFVSGVSGNPFVVAGPGEYEIKGTDVLGVATFHDREQGASRGRNTAYQITIDEIKVCHLGDLGHQLTPDQAEELNGAEILMIPVGGVFTIDAKEAMAVVNQLEPAIVIPMHFKTQKHGQVFDKVAGIDKFLKETGADGNPQKRLKIKRSQLPEETKIVVLESA